MPTLLGHFGFLLNCLNDAQYRPNPAMYRTSGPLCLFPFLFEFYAPKVQNQHTRCLCCVWAFLYAAPFPCVFLTKAQLDITYLVQWLHCTAREYSFYVLMQNCCRTTHQGNRGFENVPPQANLYSVIHAQYHDAIRLG